LAIVFLLLEGEKESWPGGAKDPSWVDEAQSSELKYSTAMNFDHRLPDGKPLAISSTFDSPG
jgi:hypothetical protein